MLSMVRRSVPYFAGMVTAFGALVVYQFLFPPPAALTGEQVNEQIAVLMASATPRAAFSAEVYEQVRPSLVMIEARNGDGEGGLGSGVVINDQGAILTSLHVVDGARRIEVTFADGTKAEAHIEVAQPENDIAVLSVARLPDVLVPAILGNPGALRVGDEAYVVGNPFGIYSSMSAGIISGFDRTFKTRNSEVELEGMIQIDAAVNPGNSGGPLLNRYGEVVGIVTGIANPTDQEVFIGIGFAVPIDVAGGAAGSPPY
jgi:S1-C subfamily serine protease